MSNEIIQADALPWLDQMAETASASFDFIFTDPPYWTLDKWRNVGTTTRLGGHRDPSKQRDELWFETINQEQLLGMLVAFQKLLKPNSHCYVMCDHEVLPIILTAVRGGGVPFPYSKPLVWDKINPGMGYHWRATVEYVVMLEKGKRRLNDLGRPDILRHKRVTGGYPTEKPLGLVEELLLNSTKPGDRCLDPFCGSGVLAEACRRHGREYVVLDKSPRAIEHTRQRVGQGDFVLNAAT